VGVSPPQRVSLLTGTAPGEKTFLRLKEINAIAQWQLGLKKENILI